MFEREEEKLGDYKNMFEQIEIPLMPIDDAILAGFQKAKLEEKQKPHWKKWMFSLIAAAMILIGFFTSIRLSPAFANFITVIPGMEKIVDIIRDDKGKMAAIENNYYEKIGVSQEKNGMKFTIDGAIADENGLVLFYTLQTVGKKEVLNIEEPHLNYQGGEKLNGGTLSSGSGNLQITKDGKTINTGTIEWSAIETPLTARKFELNIKGKGNNQIEAFGLQFELKKAIQEKKTYKLNKTVAIEGQKITFLDAIIYPLRIAVHVKMDPNNPKKLLNFDDLRLVDENGESWNKISNGITASRISDDEAIIYLQSNYFHEPKALYLVINKIQAVDKDKAVLVIDTKNKQILSQPKENLFSGVIVENDHLFLKMAGGGGFHYEPFGEIKDVNGKNVKKSEVSFSPSEVNKLMELTVKIPELQNAENPISIELSFYPAWIEGHEKIKIK
jgi:hypothetical protein